MTLTHLDVFQDHFPRDGSELIVDNFAGGGGASEGIKRALGREPDVAINHDADALAMHEMNHPATRHISKNIWQVDPLDAIEGRPVGLAWFSPDCKHFSKAKGGKPVKREIRDLAWVVVNWAKRAKPRVIILENVEEFVTWGPLKDGLPCPERKGETFKAWIGQLRKLGYKVQHKELRACDYGAPTVRKRFFLIARRDGKPIVWPKPTHGAPSDPDVIAGKKKPWRTAAEIIDWSLLCPSIFMTKEDARAYYERTGIRVNRPLADATMARIARGVFRFVIDNPKPFIVPVTHAGDHRVNSIDEPLRTQTAANRGEHAVVTPTLQHADFKCSACEEGNDGVWWPTCEWCNHEQEDALATPFLVPRYGERDGQEPRSRAIDEPFPTVVATGNEGSLIAPILVRTDHGERDSKGRKRGKGEHPVEEPIGSVTQSPDHALVAAHIMKMNLGATGHEMGEPLATVTSHSSPNGRHGGASPLALVSSVLVGCGGRAGQSPPRPLTEPMNTATTKEDACVVAAFLAQHTAGSRPGAPARDVEEPLSTLTGKGCQQSVVAAHLLNLRGEDRGGADIEAPAPTITAGGRHLAEVRAFLIKYYSTAIGQDVTDPLHTETTQARFGVVMVHGEPYQIVDIGMRMLTPRERFRAQGFGDDYIINRRPDGSPITATKQGSCAGNSVSPNMAEALVRANCPDLQAEERIAA